MIPNGDGCVRERQIAKLTAIVNRSVGHQTLDIILLAASSKPRPEDEARRFGGRDRSIDQSMSWLGSGESAWGILLPDFCVRAKYEKRRTGTGVPLQDSALRQMARRRMTSLPEVGGFA